MISTVASGAAITNVGFAFSDYDQVWRGSTGRSANTSAARSRRAGLIVAAKAADNSFRQITSNAKPIKAPEDLNGYRIRVPVAPIFTSLFQGAGREPDHYQLQ